MSAVNAAWKAHAREWSDAADVMNLRTSYRTIPFVLERGR
jgi:hypothetical protein